MTVLPVFGRVGVLAHRCQFGEQAHGGRVRPPYEIRRHRRHNAFTLIEVLATLLLLLIALPAIMSAASTAAHVTVSAHKRSQAAALAESELNELVATGAWNGGTMSGDLGSGFTWSASTSQWGSPVGVQNANTLQELDVQVFWTDAGRQQQITATILVYSSAAPSSAGGGS